MQPRFFFLLLALFFLIVLFPLLGPDGEKSTAFNFFLSVVLLFGIYSVSHKRRELIVGLFLGLPWFALNWYQLFTRAASSALALAGVGFEILFFLFTAIVILRAIFEAKRVTANIIYGAIAVYLLLAIGWASVFSAVEALRPGSFAFGVPAILRGSVTWFDLLYFSFATITTVGYGDVIPVGSLARVLSMLEMVTGVFYTAVLIARLVILYRPERG